MNSDAHSARTAATALILGEIDQLLTRIEGLPAIVDASSNKLATTITTLNAAGDRYRLAVTSFTEDAKQETVEYLKRKTIQETSRTINEQRIAMDEAARSAFNKAAIQESNRICSALADVSVQLKKASRTKLIETAAVAVMSSAVTSLIIRFITG